MSSRAEGFFPMLLGEWDRKMNDIDGNTNGEPSHGDLPARLAENISDMVVRNPAPDGSPSRQPIGIYRIIQFIQHE